MAIQPDSYPGRKTIKNPGQAPGPKTTQNPGQAPGSKTTQAPGRKTTLDPGQKAIQDPGQSLLDPGHLLRMPPPLGPPLITAHSPNFIEILTLPNNKNSAV